MHSVWVDNAWVIPVLPLLAYVVQVFAGNRLREGTSLIGITAMILSSLVATGILFTIQGGAHYAFNWLTIGNHTVQMGFQVHHLEAVLLFVVSWVATLIQVFSVGYMRGDDRYNRFFANVNLFTAAMLALLIADNILLFFVAWEIMGLCSYLLIGHWFEDPDNAAAATKAFIVTRIGDVGFLLGIWLLFANLGSFSFADLNSALASGSMSQTTLNLIALFLFAGAVGKSAQIPLHVWLPDAMAGPTPVSALIHAATMVAAGVFLVARTYPLFQAAPAILLLVGIIGGITCLFAATIASVKEDVKRVLAYSTISQLGYMMLALGVGGYVAGLFHLMTHAFFKALLFLSAGSVITATHHEQDMFKLGGLFKKMPVTTVTFIIGALALAGIPPLAGYYSKDQIIMTAYGQGYTVLFWLSTLAAGFTAFYMTRAVFMTFFGQPRDEHIFEQAKESPMVMLIPLALLSVGAIFAGFFGGWLQGFLGINFVVSDVSTASYITLGLAALGILMGVLMYGTRTIDPAAMARGLRPLYVLVHENYFGDDLAGAIAWITMVGSEVAASFDRVIVDGIVEGVSTTMVAVGRTTRRLSSGLVQGYIMTLCAGVVIGLLAYLMR